MKKNPVSKNARVPSVQSNSDLQKEKVTSPVLRGFMTDRFSNASSLTTTSATVVSTCSDRSSSGSSNTLYPSVHKYIAGRPIPSIEVEAYFKDSSSAKPPSFTHSASSSLDSQDGLAIDIINDYTDELALSRESSSENTQKTASSSPMHSPLRAKSSFASSPIEKIPEHDELKTRQQTNQQPSYVTVPKLHTPPPIEKYSSSRDRYGFLKETSNISTTEYDQWWSTYSIYYERRVKKWKRLMKDSGLSTSNPTKFPPASERGKFPRVKQSKQINELTNLVTRHIRKGLPAEWRGQAWFFYGGGQKYLTANKGRYIKLVVQVEHLDNSTNESIERDLHRTFPDNIHFRSDSAPDGGRSRATEAPMITALRRVLRSFAAYNPKIGYCQSLNFLAGLLLLFMEEEKAFWMLVVITERFLPGVHDVSLEGVNVDQGVLMLCVKDSLPKLWSKIGVNFEGQHYNNVLTSLPPITLCTAAWLMSGFIGILPTETTLRVWDILFLEGSQTFFRVALTLFKLAEPTIEKLGDSIEMFQVIQTIPKQILDVNEFLATCFKRRSLVKISEEQITGLRKFVKERRSLSLQNTSASPVVRKVSQMPPKAHASMLSVTRKQLRHSSFRKPVHNTDQENQKPNFSPASEATETVSSHDDLLEYQHYKHANGLGRSHFGLSKRMLSIKKSSHS